MSRRKTERLLSLVVCLLSSGRFLTATQIRAAVPGYPDSFDAFKRMFERDKDELRELGIPLETGSNSAADEEPGYRISRQAYMLPDIRLEPDEARALDRVGVAERLGHRQGQPRMRVGHQLEDGRNGGGGIGGGGRCENSDHVSSIHEARTVRKR